MPRRRLTPESHPVSKRNAHDFRCAQEVHWLNRDEEVPEPCPEPLPFVDAVVRRRGRTETRVVGAGARRPPMPMTPAEAREYVGLRSR